ncbi:MAG: FAD-binding protein [Coriobacteriales bacterium]|nr:FAD-binding protein [Coriobacteriales bacterium]
MLANNNVTRRNFIGAAGMAAVAGAGLVGVPMAVAAEAESDAEVPYTPEAVFQTLDCDICVVGLGMSGLAAAVQAANNGDKVIGIEVTDVTGGNGLNGVEGLFGVGSDMQKAAGIEIDPVEVVRTELSEFQMISDGALWLKLINNSADNISWLIEQGVEFSGEVDNYLGSCIVSCFHWFKNGLAADGYIPQMTARAEELGVEMLFETRGRGLVIEDGVVKGIYATDANGHDIQINAKAVILATGGYAQNPKFMAQRGWNWDNIAYYGRPHHVGDGLEMAFAAGAGNYVQNSCYNATNVLGQGLTFAWKADNFTALFLGGGMFGMGGNVLWVNQDGDRFIDESFAGGNFEMQSVPAMTQRNMYSVFDRAIAENTLAAFGDTETIGRIDACVEAGDEPDLVCADTLEEAAEKAGIDPAEFVATVERYNELCKAGADADFGKDAAKMQPIETAPFYVVKMNQCYLMSVGGIQSDINCRAITATKEPIPGLYAVGTDGCMLYRNIYTINIGGTCNANNINSGRVAANHAHKVIAG